MNDPQKEREFYTKLAMRIVFLAIILLVIVGFLFGYIIGRNM